VINEILFINKIRNTDNEDDLDYLSKMECSDCGFPLDIQKPE